MRFQPVHTVIFNKFNKAQKSVRFSVSEPISPHDRRIWVLAGFPSEVLKLRLFTEEIARKVFAIIESSKFELQKFPKFLR